MKTLRNFGIVFVYSLIMSNHSSLAVLRKQYFVCSCFPLMYTFKLQLSYSLIKNDKESAYLFQGRDREPDFSVSKVSSPLEERLKEPPHTFKFKYKKCD